MGQRRASPLRSVLLLAIVVLVIFDVLVAAATWRNYTESRDEVYDEALDEAEAYAAGAANTIANLHGVLATIASAEQMSTGDVEQIRDFIASVAGSEEAFSAGIGWIDDRGVRRINTLADGSLGTEPVDLSDRSYVREVLATGRPQTSRVLTARESGAPVVVLAVPTRDESGAVNGAVVGGIRLDDSAPTSVSGDQKNYIVDFDGVLVTGPDGVGEVRQLRSVPVVREAVASGAARGVIRDSEGIDGASVVAAHAAVGGAPWMAIVELPRGEVLGPAWRDLRTGAVILVVATLMGVAGAVYVGRRLSGQEERLRSALDQERAARWQVDQLQRLSSQLSQAVTADEAAALALAGVEEVAGSDGAGLAVVTADGERLEFVAASGFARAIQEQHRVIGRDAEAPAALAVRQGFPVWIDTAAEYAARYPHLVERIDGRIGSVAALPLTFEQRTVGVLTLLFRHDHALPTTDRPALLTIAEQAGQALGRVALLAEQRRRRARAEAMQRFTASLSMAVSVDEVGRSIVAGAPELTGADVVEVGIFDPAGRGLFILRDPSEGRMVERWKRAEPGNPIPHLETIGQREMVVAGNAVALPLRDAKDQLIGSLGMLWSEPQTFDRAQLDELAEVETVVAQAIDRAGIHQREQTVRRRAERLGWVTAGLAGATSVVAASRAILDGARQELRAAVGAVAILGEGSGELEVVSWYAPGRHFDDRRIVLTPGGAKSDAITRGRLLEAYDRETLDARFPALARGELLREAKAAVMVPLVSRSGSLGVLFLGWSSTRALDRDERSFLIQLGAQGGQALERARLFERERQIAAELQRALLPPKLPEVPHVELAARYLPASTAAVVGGDWYDAVVLDDGRLLLLVGDVVGHGITAAAAMGRLAAATRALASSHPSPSALLEALDRLASEDEVAMFATCVAVLVDPQRGLLRWSTAGHPPPVLRHPDGRVEVLYGARAMPLGTARVRRPEAETLVGGSTEIVLYTDGLVERRTWSVDDGIARLADLVRDGAADVEALCDLVTSANISGQDHADDIVVLCARIGDLAAVHAGEFRRVVAADARMLGDLRQELREWFAELGLAPDDADDLLLAVGEAAANAIEHGHQFDGRPIEVRGTRTETGLVFTIRDDGRWREPAAERPFRGWGLQLMRRLVDEVDVGPSNGGGTVVTLRKELVPARSG